MENGFRSFAQKRNLKKLIEYNSLVENKEQERLPSISGKETSWPQSYPTLIAGRGYKKFEEPFGIVPCVE
jgi:hypothetical protein